MLSAAPLDQPFAASQKVFADRQAEADAFYRDLLPEASDEDRRILRQASVGMIWSKQFFHYDVSRWLYSDQFPPPDDHHWGWWSIYRSRSGHDLQKHSIYGPAASKFARTA